MYVYIIARNESNSSSSSKNPSNIAREVYLAVCDAIRADHVAWRTLYHTHQVSVPDLKLFLWYLKFPMMTYIIVIKVPDRDRRK